MKTIMMMAICLALGACSEMGTNRSASTDGGASSTNSGYGATQSSSASSTDQYDATVVLVEEVPRSDLGTAAGGAVGAAAAGTPMDKAYRVTLRKDDGTNQMVTVTTMPGYKPGDRVSYRNGSVMIAR
ncbi:MAG TPA: hypothetical protein VGF27_12270 [Pseudoduganella sp.]